MSQHPSLRSSDKDKQHRSVLKRHERLKILKEKELWKEGSSVFGLPKVKVLRFKIKKEKAQAAAETPEGATLAAGQEGSAQPASSQGEVKPGAQPKTAQPKTAQPKEAAKPAKGQEGKK